MNQICSHKIMPVFTLRKYGHSEKDCNLIIFALLSLVGFLPISISINPKYTMPLRAICLKNYCYLTNTMCVGFENILSNPNNPNKVHKFDQCAIQIICSKLQIPLICLIAILMGHILFFIVCLFICVHTYFLSIFGTLLS